MGTLLSDSTILTTHLCPDLDSVSDWLKRIFTHQKHFPHLGNICVMMRHQHGIFALVPQTSRNFGCFLRLQNSKLHVCSIRELKVLVMSGTKRRVLLVKQIIYVLSCFVPATISCHRCSTNGEP